MSKIFGVVLLGLAVGCAPKPQADKAEEKVDNTVTRYVGALQTGVEKSQSVRDLANQKMEANQAALDDAQKALE